MRIDYVLFLRFSRFMEIGKKPQMLHNRNNNQETFYISVTRIQMSKLLSSPGLQEKPRITQC